METTEYKNFKIIYISSVWANENRTRYLLYKVENNDQKGDYTFSVSEFESQKQENRMKDIEEYKKLALSRIKEMLDKVGVLANQTLIYKFEDNDFTQ
jgi:hypothetical protein